MLLPAGLEQLQQRFEVRVGGLDAGRETVLEVGAGAGALVADPAVPVDEQLLVAAGPQLKLVANFAVGHDNIDLEACRSRGVVVTNTPDVLTNATAELALALSLAAARLLSDAERDLREGRWEGWDPSAYRGLELSGAMVGVVGLGRIGTRYAELCHGFGAELAYASPSPKPDAERALAARQMELDQLLGSADVISLHAPSRPDTHHLIDARAIGLMQPHAVLVNTSRGPLVDLEAVAAALEEGRLGAAGLDVYEGEPQVPDAVRAAPRTVPTPHIGSATVKARDGMAGAGAADVMAGLEGGGPPTPGGPPDV